MREPFVITHKQPAIRFLLAPHHGGSEMQSIPRAKAKSFQLQIRQLADFFGRLDFTPRRKQLAQPLFGRAVGVCAELLPRSQALEGAPRFQWCEPPDYRSLFA